MNQHDRFLAMPEMTIIHGLVKNWLRTPTTIEFLGRWEKIKEVLIKSFDKLRTNGKVLITFVVSLSNHECNQLIQSFLNNPNFKGVEFDSFKSEAGMNNFTLSPNLESINAELIRQGIAQTDRITALNQIAIHQVRFLLGAPEIKKLK